jgi:16S rRNA processing protein RimM
VGRKPRRTRGSLPPLAGEGRAPRAPASGAQGAGERGLERQSIRRLPGNLIRVGRIGAPHGIRGEIKLWSFTEEPAAIAGYGPLAGEDGRTFEIVSMRAAKEGFVARLKGVADRDAAEALTNLDLYVAREKLPALDDASEFYHADLIGLAAVDTQGGALGTVIAVHNFGAGDLLEIAPTGGGATLMLPFTQQVVPMVDIAGRRMQVVLPPESDVSD